MGRQFQVYLLPSDAVRLLEVLRQEVGLRLLASRSPGPQPIEVESPVQTSAGHTRVDCLIAPADLITVKLDPLEKQGCWSVNTLFSEVIEFNACHYDKTTLKRGRLFYDTGFYKSDLWQEKSKHFLNWAETAFKAAKKSLKRSPSLDAYIGKDADRWHSIGGRICSIEHQSSVQDVSWINYQIALACFHAYSTDYRYDAAGNMTFDATASLSYTFDQENRLTGAAG